jgi:hypothetical protein
MSDPKAAIFDDMVGRPFWPLSLPEHSVCGETFEGQKIRAAGVETVWNDMLLMDTVEGEGFYFRGAGKYERACLEVAERMYAMSAAEGLKHWLTMPKRERKAVN